MASVERAMAKAAAALLPGLLPTPPVITPCIVIIPPAAPNPKHPKPGRADSCARWDINKKIKNPISSSSGSASSSSLSQGSGGGGTNPGRASSCEKWDSSKRSPSRGADSGRWDAHKRPRAAENEQKEQDISKEPKEEEETTSSMVATAKSVDPVFSGPSFFDSSPEPSMLPMPPSSLAVRA